MGQIIDFETKLGHKATWEEMRAEELRRMMEIKGYCNHQGWSDCCPFEVVKTISKTTVEIRAMDTVQTVMPTDFRVGGFSAHCADNRAQKYDYTSNEENEIIRVRFSKAKRRWQDKYGRRYSMSDKPYKFYDYNF